MNEIKRKTIASKTIEKSKNFIEKLLSEKATRLMLRKNAQLLRETLTKGYKQYQTRSGVTSVSTANQTTKSASKQKDGQHLEQNSNEEEEDEEEQEEQEDEDSSNEFYSAEENDDEGEDIDEEPQGNEESDREFEELDSESGIYEADCI